ELSKGNTGRGRAMYELALEILEHQNEWMVAHADSGLARVALREGDRVTARRLADEALAIYRGFGDQRLTTGIMYLLANIDIAEFELDAARAQIREALTICQSLADPIGMMTGLVTFGLLAVAEHRPQRALRLFGAASVHGDGGEFDFVRRRLMLDQHI